MLIWRRGSFDDVACISLLPFLERVTHIPIFEANKKDEIKSNAAQNIDLKYVVVKFQTGSCVAIMVHLIPVIAIRSYRKPRLTATLISMTLGFFIYNSTYFSKVHFRGLWHQL